MRVYSSANRRIGQNLQQLRLTRLLTQDALARTLDLTRSTISAIESGLRSLTLAEAVLLEERYDFSLADLTDGCPFGF